MSRGLHFTPEEEREFAEMTKLRPRGFGERTSVWFDRVANTVWMFFALLTFSLVSYIFLQRVLNQMLFLSNTYQLIALPILGVATGLSTTIILRFLFRILLEIRKEFAEMRRLHADVRRERQVLMDYLREMSRAKGERS